MVLVFYVGYACLLTGHSTAALCSGTTSTHISVITLLLRRWQQRIEHKKLFIPMHIGWLFLSSSHMSGYSNPEDAKVKLLISSPRHYLPQGAFWPWSSMLDQVHTFFHVEIQVLFQPMSSRFFPRCRKYISWINRFIIFFPVRTIKPLSYLPWAGLGLVG